MRYNSKRFLALGAFAIFVALSPVVVRAHKGKIHSEQSSQTVKNVNADIKLASDLYVKSVEAIFKKSCFDCHGTATEMPWYYKVPGIKGMIDEDMKEAKKHLDMRKGFPFAGHGSVVEDLKAIQSAISEEKMPPRNYRIMHPSSKLIDEEKKSVNKWIKDSLDLLDREPR